MSLRRNHLVAVAAALLAPLGAHAQEQGVQPGKEVVVTATRVPTDPAKVASSITVITAEEIERRQLRTLADILQTVPGLAVVRSGGPGQTTSVFSRGTESNHTLFMINGIEASDPSSPGDVFELEHVLAQDIDRVEVVRGPQSVLYGSDAVGAVVNVITRQGAGRPTLTGSIEGGSFGTVNGQAGFSGSNDRVDYAVSGIGYHTDGISALADRLGGHEKDGYDNTGATANLGLHPSENLTIRGFAKATWANTQIDTFVDDPNAHVDTRQIFASGESVLDLLEGAWVSTLGLAVTDQNREVTNSGNDGEFDGRRIKASLQNDFHVSDQHTLTLGGEHEWARGKTTGFESFSGDVTTNSVFAQDQFAFFADRLVGAVGVRYDHFSDFGSEVTYRIAPAWLIPQTGTKLKGSYGTAFKAPSLEDRFGGDGVFVVGNPNLNPEKSRGWDAGFEQSLFSDRLRFGSTYFRNDITDLITIPFVAPFPNEPENVQRAKTWGFESFIAGEPLPNLSVRLDYTWLRTEDESTNKELLRRPHDKVNLDVAYRPFDPLTLTFDLLYVGQRRDINAVTFNQEEENPYTVVNVMASYQALQNLSVFGRIENLFDANFENPNGFGQPGRGFFVGLSARL